MKKNKKLKGLFHKSFSEKRARQERFNQRWIDCARDNKEIMWEYIYWGDENE